MDHPNSRRVTNFRRKNKNVQKKFSDSPFSVLPNDLIVEILANAAASSSKNFFNSKLTCKEFHEIADDAYIYKHVSLDRICVPPWRRRKQVNSFLHKCRESGNPEALFKQGVIDYFGRSNELESGLECLRKSANSGNFGASYVLGVILFCSGDEPLKEQGMQLLDYVKAHRKLVYCRRKLQEIRKRIWMNKTQKFNAKSNSCPMEEKHKRKEGWTYLDIDDEEDEFDCNECSFNYEVRLCVRKVMAWR